MVECSLQHLLPSLKGKKFLLDVVIRMSYKCKDLHMSFVKDIDFYH